MERGLEGGEFGLLIIRPYWRLPHRNQNEPDNEE
jgi:hypothetical protein